MFGRMFGKGGGGGGHPPPGKSGSTQTVDAIQTLGTTEELLNKRKALLEKKMATELENAKKYTAEKNKKAALNALKKKKMYETQLEQVNNNLLRVSEQQMMLENQRTTVETVAALREGAKAQKATMSEMKINDVDQVLEEINEQGDQMQQIQDAMAQPIGMAGQVDEDELLAELGDLEAEQLDEQLLEPAPVPARKVPAQAAAQAAPAQALPSAPTGKAPPKKAPAKSQEDLELEALEREMAA